MDNREFDKRVRELMDGHLEMPDSSLWDSIATSLAQRKRARVLYMRRALIGTAAVAASLALIFFLDSGESTAPSQKAIIEKLAQEVNPIKTESKSEVTAQLLPEHKYEKTGVVVQEGVKESVKEPIKVSAQEPVKEPVKVSTQEPIKVSTQEPARVPVQESVKETVKEPAKEVAPKSSPAKKSDDRSYLFENNYNRRSHRKGSTLLAVSTNISPSTASNSVSLMGLSQAQSGYSVSNVVPTFQKAYVPQEVISNTKFLMPISLGVQAQFPLTGKLSFAT